MKRLMLIVPVAVFMIAGCDSSTETTTPTTTSTTEVPAQAAQEAAQNPCAVDVTQFCQGIEPGEGRVTACLIEHKEQVSSACRATMPN